MKRSEIHKNVTDMMIASINQGTPPWRKTWSLTSRPDVIVESPNVGSPCNFHSGRCYSGINPLLLMLASQHYGYDSRQWGTDKAWMNHLGAKTDGHATSIILFAFVPKRDKAGKVETNKAGEKITFPLMREFPLFNAAQVKPPIVEELLDGRCGKKTVSVVKSLLKGTEARRSKSTVEELRKIAGKYAREYDVSNLTRLEIAQVIHRAVEERIHKYLIVEIIESEPDFALAEEFIKTTGAKIVYGPDPKYKYRGDMIQMPSKRNFDSLADYYESIFHELCHWGEVRVGRKNNDYNFGELVAEIGACFLMMEIGVPMHAGMMEQRKAYVKSWLRGMESDHRFIFDASKQASKVVDFLLSISNNNVKVA
jgi:antirestriction protein ArdC